MLLYLQLILKTQMIGCSRKTKRKVDAHGSLTTPMQTFRIPNKFYLLLYGLLSFLVTQLTPSILYRMVVGQFLIWFLSSLKIECCVYQKRISRLNRVFRISLVTNHNLTSDLTSIKNTFCKEYLNRATNSPLKNEHIDFCPSTVAPCKNNVASIFLL